MRIVGGNVHWALPSLTPAPTTPSSSGSRFSRSSRRCALYRMTCHHNIILLYRSGRSVGTSSSLLSQTFSLIVRQIAVVLETSFDIRELPVPSFQLPISQRDPERLAALIWSKLEPVWAWLAINMDSVEILVRRGNEVSQRAPFRSKSYLILILY